MPARKRTASTSFETPEPRRRSGRISSSGKSSVYFEADSDEDELGEEVLNGRNTNGKPSKRSAAGKKAVEDDHDTYDDEAQQTEDGGDVDDEEDDEDAFDEEDLPKKQSNGREKKKKKKTNKREVEEEEDDDEDGPKVTFVPHAKLRATGGVPYEDDRLHQNTMLFLKDLKANNKRSWLKAHDEEFRRSLDDWKSFVETLTQKIIEVDDTIPELPAKDIIFRIYRDVRFSKDPTPYKAHYSAAWSRTGKKGPYAAYYLHCEPGNVFVGGGLWQPEAATMAKLRASIDERPQRWRRVLMDETFRRTFMPKAKATEKAVLKAFAEENKSGALKTKPKGFVAEHRDIELLKLRSFTVSKKLTDAVLCSARGQDEVAGIIAAMRGFITHLNSIVMPDPGQNDSSDEEDGPD